jgi:hypothetical protein
VKFDAIFLMFAGAICPMTLMAFGSSVVDKLLSLIIACFLFPLIVYGYSKYQEKVSIKSTLSFGLLFLVFGAFEFGFFFRITESTFGWIVFSVFCYAGFGLITIVIYLDLVDNCNENLGLLDSSMLNDQICALMLPCFSLGRGSFWILWVVANLLGAKRINSIMWVVGLCALVFALIYEYQFHGIREFIAKRRRGISQNESELRRKDAYYALVEDD